MKGWVGPVGWPIAAGLHTFVVTHQLQVEHKTGKVRLSKTNVLPLNQTNHCATHSNDISCRLLYFTICIKFPWTLTRLLNKHFTKYSANKRQQTAKTTCTLGYKRYRQKACKTTKELDKHHTTSFEKHRYDLGSSATARCQQRRLASTCN